MVKRSVAIYLPVTTGLSDLLSDPKTKNLPMNNPNQYSQAEEIREAFRHHPRTAAVIRPLESVEGADHSFRVDADESLRGPHRRSQQLNDYVGWLQQQSMEQINRTDQTERKNQENAHSESNQSTKSKELNMGEWTFSKTSKLIFGIKSNLDVPIPSQPTTHLGPEHSIADPAVRNSKSKPIIEFVTTRTVDKTKTRMDSAHAADGSRGVPRPKTNPSEFEVDADLGRILKKLETAEVNTGKPPITTGDCSDEWLDDSPISHGSTRTPVPTTSVPGVVEQPKAGNQNRVSPSTRGQKVVPAEFIYPDSVIDDQMNHAISNQAESGGLSKQEIIETVSKAIATVLTDQSEAVIERKVRERFEELQRVQQNQANANPAISPSVVQSDLPSSANIPIPDNKSATPKPNSVEPNSVDPNFVDSKKFAQTLDASKSVLTLPPKSGSTKVPVEVAAWDVNDFRWPTISTQMITVGSKAIEALYRSLEPSPRKTPKNGRKRVAITAMDRNAGTTSIAMSLARWGASEGQRILLVDADLQNPELSSQVGLGNKISWMQGVVTHSNPKQINVADLIIRSQQSQLCVMPLVIDGDMTSRPKFVLDYLARLVDQVLDQFDLIVIDFGTANQIQAELSHAELLVDTVLLVHQQRTTALDQLQISLKNFGVQQFVLAQNAAQSSVSANVA